MIDLGIVRLHPDYVFFYITCIVGTALLVALVSRLKRIEQTQNNIQKLVQGPDTRNFPPLPDDTETM